MKTPKNINIEKLWMEEFTSKDDRGIDHCGLCANHGIVDTSKMKLKTPAGMTIEAIKTYCICPNGRVLRKSKVKI